MRMHWRRTHRAAGSAEQDCAETEQPILSFTHTVAGNVYRFDDLKTLLAKATPERSGDQLAGVAAQTALERMAARLVLADLPLRTFLNEQVVPCESDEVTA